MEQKSYSEIIAEELIQAIKEGTAPWQRPWQPGEAMLTAPMNPITGQAYRGTNSLYLRMAGYDDPRWLTYNQAQSIGAQVRKGEHGHTVQCVKLGEMRDILDEHGQPRLDENGEKQRRFVRYERPKVFSARVFNAEQIDGMPPLPTIDERAHEVNMPEIHARVEAILQASQADIRHKEGDQAFYSPAQDYIQLPELHQFADASAYYAVALHELGHWTGHPSRLDRDLSHPFGSAGYAREELRAEISSFMNAQRFGVPHDPTRHASYVGSWIRALEDDPQEIIIASAAATEISNFVAAFEQVQVQQQTQTPEQTAHRQEMSMSNRNQADSQPQARIYLDVPYTEKDQAKALGARWDGKEKKWYIPPNIDAKPLQKWISSSEAGNKSIISEKNTAQHGADTTQVAEQKTFLAVPYEEKADAKALGAKWDNDAKSWYAPEGADMAALQRWIPKEHSYHAPQQGDPLTEFAHALAAAGLIVKDIRADGQLHRVPVDGRPRGKDGAYKLHLDGKPSGFIQNFVTGHKENWTSQGQMLSAAELSAQRAAMAALRAQREQEREAEYTRNAAQAHQEWESLTYADANHPYLVKKALDFEIINKLGIKEDERGNLVIPIVNKDFQIQSLQRIGENGFKQFATGCKAHGGFMILGNDFPGQYVPDPRNKLDPHKSEPVIIATGVATAASIHMATGEPVVVAFQDSNLMAVAEEFKAMYPYRSFFIVGDNDQHNVAKGLKNGGLEAARAAAKAVGGRYVVPTFAAGQSGKDFSDFSDLHRVAGLAAVKRQIQAGLAVARGNVAEDKERIQSQEQSQERVEKEVQQRKLDEENAQKKRRTRSL